MLQWRDVLILVDDEKAILLVHLQRHARLSLEEPGGEQQNVFEVNSRALILDAFVGALNLNALLHGEGSRHRTRRRAEGVGIEGEVGYLAPFHLRRHVTQRRGVEFEP